MRLDFDAIGFVVVSDDALHELCLSRGDAFNDTVMNSIRIGRRLHMSMGTDMIAVLENGALVEEDVPAMNCCPRHPLMGWVGRGRLSRQASKAAPLLIFEYHSKKIFCNREKVVDKRGFYVILFVIYVEVTLWALPTRSYGTC